MTTFVKFELYVLTRTVVPINASSGAKINGAQSEQNRLDL